MAALLSIGATACCLWATVAILRRYQLSGRLSAIRFATIFAGGWGIALLVFFFANLILGNAHLNGGLVGLGIGIAVLNFVLAYPIAYYSFRTVLHRYLKPPEHTND